jgi:hypothetical protein
MRSALYFAIRWGVATLFWLLLGLATEWTDSDFLECIFFLLVGPY